jgi:hypothetical protein
MPSDKNYVIHLNGFDLGQLIDGLEVRTNAWRKTAEYLQNGELPPDCSSIEECDDADEARQIAEHYERIMATIIEQQKEQDRT